jgi:biotin-(acetyl-CoA carboxylase) ligase
MTASPAPIVRLAVVESTQAAAFDLAAEGAVDRTVVVADHQLAGRGRRGRTWTDAPGTSLLASILIRPRVTPPLLGTFSIAAGVAVVEALRRVTGIEARLKWPNDVLVHGRKVAGILVESRIGADVSVPRCASGRSPTGDAGHAAPVTDAATRTSGRSPTGDAGHAAPVTDAATRTSGWSPTGDAGHAAPVTVVVGVGLNLAQRAFPEELAARATSVVIETGRAPDRDAMLETLLEEFDAWRWRLELQGFGQVRERWLALSDTIGRRVTVDAITGVAVGLGADGALLVDDGRGERRIVAGEIAPEVTHAPRR